MDVDMGSASSPPQSETIGNAVKEKQEGVDRISEFPDDILGRILYFLPSKDAAATTILSSRWKHVFWSTATMLDVDISQSSFAKDNTIRFFEALFNCRTLISACITTNFFHVPAAFCLPKLKHLFVKSTEDFDSLEKTHDRLQDTEEARFEYIFGGKFIVFQKKVKPTEEEDLFGVQSLPSLSIC